MNKLIVRNTFWTTACLVVVGWVALVLSPAVPAPVAYAAAVDGKAVFMAQKCNLCHGIESQGIASKATSEKTKGPDLSKVATKHDAAWISKFLKREEKIDGKVHKKETKATDEELAALVAWLMTLK